MLLMCQILGKRKIKKGTVKNLELKICCLPRKIQNFDKQNPKFQQPVETVENFKKFVQLKQNKLI